MVTVVITWYFFCLEHGPTRSRHIDLKVSPADAVAKAGTPVTQGPHEQKDGMVGTDFGRNLYGWDEILQG